MIKVHLHFMGVKDGGVQNKKLTLKAACGSFGGIREFKAAFGKCDLTIGVCTGKEKVGEPFLNVFAIPTKKKGKYRFKMQPVSGYFWFTWIKGQGGGLSFSAYSAARFEYNGHSLEIEKEGG